MSLLRFSISSILRNRRRTFSSVLGVLLAITFIAGTFIAIDSSARATLDAALGSLPGDFNYYATPISSPGSSTAAVLNGSVLRDALAAVSGVTDVSVYRQLNAYSGRMGIYPLVGGSPNSSGYVWGVTAIDPAHLPYNYRLATFTGSLALPNGSLALDSDTARSIGVTVGDSVVLVNQVNSWSNVSGTYVLVNYTATFTVGAVLTLPSYEGGPYLGPYPGPYAPSVVAINARDLPWVASRLNITDPYASQLQGEIWINRDQYVNPYDIPGSTFQLTRLDRRLSAALVSASYYGTVNDNVASALTGFSNTLLVQRVQYLFLSVPVVLLGLYLGAVGVDLGHAERRRELGVLKTRGASRRQIALLLITESVLGGLVATVVGLLLGVVLSRFLIGIVTPFGSSADYAALSLTPDTVIVVTILSIVFMLIAGYRSAKRTSSLPIIETLRYYAPGETRIEYSPVADILMIAFSAVMYGVLYYSFSNPGGFMMFIIGVPLLIALPLTPILLVVGLTRLFTRSTGKVYQATSRLMRPFAKNLEFVIGRNLSRNPRRSSSIAIIIALGLAFGIFIFTSLGSSQALQEQSLRANVGADIQVMPPYTTNATAYAGFRTNLSAVPGIAQVTRLTSVSAEVVPTPLTGHPIVMALDPSTYFSVSQPASYFFDSPGTQLGAEQILATNGSVLITNQFAKDAALQIGDTLLLTTTYYSNTTPVTTRISVQVAGIVRFLPGTFPGSFFGSATAPDEVYGSFTTFAALIAAQSQNFLGYGSDRFLASFQPGADWHTIKADVLALGATGIQVYQEQLDQVSNNPFASSILGFIRMEIAFIVVILTAGLALIIYAASLERTVEFAGITARGSSGWQTASLLLGEAIAIMIIGVLVGLAVGLLTGYLSVVATTPTFSGAEPIIPNVFYFPPEGWLLVVLAVVAMLGTAVAVSWRIARMNVARVLKMRGG